MITSTKNQLVGRIRRLKQKKHRIAEGAFFVEGIRLVGLALEMGAEVEQLVWCEALLSSDFGRNQVKTHAAIASEVSQTVFKAFSDRDKPIGLAAIIRTPDSPSVESLLQGSQRIVALDRIADPGNLGTILRTIDAAGFDGLVLVGDTVDCYHSAAVKASMGALFSVPVASVRSLELLFDATLASGHAVVATTANADFDYREFEAPEKLLLLMGAEKFGLSAETIQRADHTVSIPMRGSSTSLNLAIATGILLYQYA